jgi:hypothetical protein
MSKENEAFDNWLRVHREYVDAIGKQANASETYFRKRYHYLLTRSDLTENERQELVLLKEMFSDQHS